MDDDRAPLPQIVADLRRVVLESCMDAVSKLRAMVAIDRFQLDVQRMQWLDAPQMPPRDQVHH